VTCGFGRSAKLSLTAFVVCDVGRQRMVWLAETVYYRDEVVLSLAGVRSGA
jgi:hypothetical protein